MRPSKDIVCEDEGARERRQSVDELLPITQINISSESWGNLRPRDETRGVETLAFREVPFVNRGDPATAWLYSYVIDCLARRIDNI